MKKEVKELNEFLDEYCEGEETKDCELCPYQIECGELLCNTIMKKLSQLRE